MITAILSSSTTSTITAQAEVIIGGRKVDPYQVSVEQNVDTHHRFTVAVSAEKIEGTSIGVGIDNSINYIGQAAQLVVHHLDNTLNFVGIITGVHIDPVCAITSILAGVFTAIVNIRCGKKMWK